MTNVQILWSISTLRSAARLERSSFFEAGKAKAKIAGVEGGRAAQKINFIDIKI